MIGGATLSPDEQRIVEWLDSEYRTSDELPTDARHMLMIVRQCIERGSHRTPTPALLEQRDKA
jgi:hypothetical protein